MRISFTAEQWAILLWLASGKILTISAVTAFTRLPGANRHKIYQVEAAEGQTGWELRSAWVLLTDAVVLGVLLTLGLLRPAADTLATAALTFTALFVWAELWMYWAHRLMHRFNLLWKIHEQHHRSVVPQPLTATSFSLAEKLVVYTLGWLGFAAALSWVAPVSLYGIVAYYSFYFITSPLAHANVETTDADSLNARWGLGRILGTSTGHAMHHARCHGNFGFLTSLTDRMFGTYLPDTPAIQRRAWAGRGLASTDEKLDGPAV